MKIASAILATSVLLMTPQLGLAEDVYAVDPRFCASGEEGVIVVGAGYFSTTDSTYERVGHKTDLGNGFFSARYALTAEGESYGEETVRMRLSADKAEIVFEDGHGLVGKRCGGEAAPHKNVRD